MWFMWKCFCPLLYEHLSLCPSLLDEFKSFLKRLPATHFLPVSSVHLLWGSDWDLQNRYRLLQSSLEAQRLKIQRTARKLFGLSIRCHHNPNHQMPRERWEALQHEVPLQKKIGSYSNNCSCSSSTVAVHYVSKHFPIHFLHRDFSRLMN